MAARAEMVAEPVGANITMAFAQFGKVLAALAAGRHDDAYASADRLFEPGDSAYHPVISSWLIGDLAEAARHVGLDAARARLAQVERRPAIVPAHGSPSDSVTPGRWSRIRRTPAIASTRRWRAT